MLRSWRAKRRFGAVSPALRRRGGNRHTTALHLMTRRKTLTDTYPEEFWQDLQGYRRATDEALARLTIRQSATCRGWMRKHGVHFQPSLSGTLHLSRTNAFFMGGGKALVNAYYRSAEALGVEIRYNAPVDRVEHDGDRFVAAYVGAERIAAKTCARGGRLRIKPRMAT